MNTNQILTHYRRYNYSKERRHYTLQQSSQVCYLNVSSGSCCMFAIIFTHGSNLLFHFFVTHIMSQRSYNLREEGVYLHMQNQISVVSQSDQKFPFRDSLLTLPGLKNVSADMIDNNNVVKVWKEYQFTSQFIISCFTPFTLYQGNFRQITWCSDVHQQYIQW